MIKFLLAAMACVVGQALSAQHQLSGYVYDAVTGLALPDVGIQVMANGQGTYTNGEGYFALDFSGLEAELSLVLLGYEPRMVSYPYGDKAQEGLPVFLLSPQVQELAEAVVVSTTRMDEKEIKTAVTLKRTEIQKLNTGQDLPLLLMGTPGLVSSSDAGNGIGYSQLRIRGMDMTRINVTVNGVPINDQESHNVWWVNMPDLSSSINTIQIQRGVGTSTNGGQAFGSSINIETKKLSLEPTAQLSSSAGSFGAWKGTMEFSTGMLPSHWGFTGRLSRMHSDGYIDRAFADLKSYYLAGHYVTRKQSLRLTAFSGAERTYQAWGGVPAHILATNRTYNPFTYQNQTDNYQQDHYQLHYTRNTHWAKANLALHYTRGRGYYEEYIENDLLATYGLPFTVIDSITHTTTHLVRQRWLSNHFVGGIYSLEHKRRMGNYAHLQVVLGGSYNRYWGQHFGEIVWANRAPYLRPGQEYYRSEAVKTNTNNYIKTKLAWTKATVQGEIQVRSVRYGFQGLDNNLSSADHQLDYFFVNPKLMASYNMGQSLTIYAYYGKSAREPLREDLVMVAPNDWPGPEVVHDMEAGAAWDKKDLKAGINLFFMNFKDQLVLNGAINDVGAYLRTNVARSYRMGLELEAALQLTPKISWSGNISLSDNRIQSFTAFIDEVDVEFNQIGQVSESFDQTPISFSPATVGFSVFQFQITGGLNMALQTKFVGKQFIDNTGSTTAMIDPYVVSDLILNYELKPKSVCQSLVLQAMAYNIMNERYEAAAYTWMYRQDGGYYHDNYYFPQAGRSYMVGMVLVF
ncbi:MAG: TonB-dependent receptor plug domain-containing protein [Bacteroidetes bacterium]|nr:TonB-dependent receptor plug domain-containing protein [Bacteroidota bacterium]